MGIRAQHRADMRARIVNAAMGMIVESGLDGWSMRGLARKVELTPGALYRYFDNDQALLAELTGAVIDDLAWLVERTESERPREQPLARLLFMVEAYRAASLADPNRFGLVSMLLAAPRVVISEQALARPLVDRMMQALEPLVRSLEECVDLGQLAPGSSWDRAVTMFGTIQGLLMLRKQASRAPELFDPERLVIEAICNHLKGWGASDEDVLRAINELGGDA